MKKGQRGLQLEKEAEGRSGRPLGLIGTSMFTLKETGGVGNGVRRATWLLTTIFR